MRIPDEVFKCVVFVGLDKPTLPMGVDFIGTAFFVLVPSSIKGTSYIYLVTAKHVAEKLGNRDFIIRINTRDGRSLILEAEGAKWFTHPTDSSVDVAVLPHAPSKTEFDYKAVHIESFLSEEIIRKEGIGVGDEVFITGLFVRASGSARNQPIVRIGNIAMMPDEALPTRWGNIEAYLIEARSIGGLSGSPAFVRATTGRSYLLGLMRGHWDIPAETEEIYVKVNVGIAIVEPAKKISEVLNHPELVKMREQNDTRLLLKQSDSRNPCGARYC